MASEQAMNAGFDLPLDVFRAIAGSRHWLVLRWAYNITEFCGMSSLLAAGCTSFVLCSFIYTISGTASRLLSKACTDHCCSSCHSRATDLQQACYQGPAPMGTTHSYMPCLRSCLHQNSGLNRSSMGFLLALIGFRVLWEGPPADIVSGTTDLLTHTASFALGNACSVCPLLSLLIRFLCA